MEWNRDGNGNAIAKLTHESKENRVIYNLSMNGDITMNNFYYTCNTTRSETNKYGCKSSKIMIDGTTYRPSVEFNSSMQDPEAICQYCKGEEEENARLKNIIDQLNETVESLKKHRFQIDSTHYRYKWNLEPEVGLNQTIEDSKAKAVTGIAVLGKELFVVKEPSPESEVYETNTFAHMPNLKTDQIENPLDMVGLISKATPYLYIINRVVRVTDKANCQILRIKPKCDSDKVMELCSVDGDQGRLSSYASNIHSIVCSFVFEKENGVMHVTENTEDGVILSTVDLQLSCIENFIHPWHAIKVSRTHFVITDMDGKNKIRRIGALNVDGTAVKIYHSEIKLAETNMSPNLHEQLHVPICLLEDNEGYILLADGDQNGILVLNSALDKLQQQLQVCHSSNNEHPTRLCFDKTENRLFVAINKVGDGRWTDGRVSVFNKEKRNLSEPFQIN